jgi:hypothetical protein
MDYCGGGYGEHIGIGFLSQSSLLSFATNPLPLPSVTPSHDGTVHQQPTKFERELTKLRPYESSNAAPAKMFSRDANDV